MLMEYLFEQVCTSVSTSQSRAGLCWSVTGVEFLGSWPRGSHILYLCHLCRLFQYVSCSSAAGLNHSLTLIHIPSSLSRGIINLGVS